MQSICLKEAGLASSGCLEEETTLIGLTFGGYLRSKVKTKTNLFFGHAFSSLSLSRALEVLFASRVCVKMQMMHVDLLLFSADKVHEVPRQVRTS